jgi:hypothetical protein
MKRPLFFFLLVSLCLATPSGFKRLTHGFRPEKLQLAFPNEAHWEVQEVADVQSILRQPFRYLNKGAQAYVFESLDKEYVIKLFRFDHLSKKTGSLKRFNHENVFILFNACKMAYETMAKETGLIYIHLNTTDGKMPVLHCRDRLGRKHALPLDQIRFVLQKKAGDFCKSLLDARSSPERMKKRIDSLLALLDKRIEKGILNTDPNLKRNFGFIGDQAIELDFGNYRFHPGHNREKEREKYLSKLHQFLEKQAPEWAEYLDRKRCSF